MFRAPASRLAPALSILACLLAAPSAMAAGASVDNADDRLELTAATGERNLITVTGSPNTYILEDAVSNITAGSGCTQLTAKRVRCSGGSIKSIYLDLRDQDDSVVSSASMRVDISAGDGADKLTGSASHDRLSGGPGDDLLDGGLGADLIVGDDGRDRVTYGSRTAPVNVSVGAYWGDGQAGEWDYVSASVEEVVGGSGNDKLTGSAAANTFIGGLGTDTLEGRDGNDVLEGGEGADKLDGGDGDDVLTSRDTAVDTVDCGAGNDTVDVDAADVLATDCELPAAPAPAPAAATLDRVPSTVTLTRKGYVRIRVTCPRTALNGCTGHISIEVLARGAAVLRSGVSQSAAGPRFRLKAGETEVTKVKISRNGRHRVLKKKRAKCKVSVRTSSAGTQLTVSKKVTVKAPKRKRSRR